MSYLVGSTRFGRDTHLVSAGGELDMGAAPELRAALEEALEAGVTHVVVDLSDARFIDSTAIGILISARLRFRQAGGSLELVCTEPNLLRIFEVVGIDRDLSIHASRDAAIEAFAGVR